MDSPKQSSQPFYQVKIELQRTKMEAISIFCLSKAHGAIKGVLNVLMWFSMSFLYLLLLQQQNFVTAPWLALLGS